MYALNLAEHSRRLSISNRAFRFWVRAWIDSLHVGAHIHWQLSPLSILGLAHIWVYTNRQRPRYTDRQRTSIKAMARRRRADPACLGTMPAFDGTDSAWDAFFAQQIAARDEIRERLVQWHMTGLATCSDIPLLYGYMNSFFAAFVVSGLTTDQLFRAVCKGVLDPEGFRKQTPSENLVSWLDSYASPAPTEFLAYTRLAAISPDPISKTLRRKWSAIKLPDVGAFQVMGDDAVEVVVRHRAP